MIFAKAIEKGLYGFCLVPEWDCHLPLSQKTQYCGQFQHTPNITNKDTYR